MLPLVLNLAGMVCAGLVTSGCKLHFISVFLSRLLKNGTSLILHLHSFSGCFAVVVIQIVLRGHEVLFLGLIS